MEFEPATSCMTGAVKPACSCSIFSNPIQELMVWGSDSVPYSDWNRIRARRALAHRASALCR